MARHLRVVGRDAVAERMLIRLSRTGSIIRDHVRLTSGRHAPAYLNVKNIFGGGHHYMAVNVCHDLTDTFRGIGIEAVVGPESGAIPIAKLSAEILSLDAGRDTQCEIRAITAWKRTKTVPSDPQDFLFTPDDQMFLANKSVLVVEDVITTAGSVGVVCQRLRELGCTVIGVACVVDRSGLNSIEMYKILGTPLSSLLQVVITSWPDAPSCPLCMAGIPINPKYGKGKLLL